MKRDQRKGSRGKYRMAAVLAAFCVIGNGIVALGAPVSDEEQLTAGVGQILDSLPETRITAIPPMPAGVEMAHIVIVVHFMPTK